MKTATPPAKSRVRIAQPEGNRNIRKIYVDDVEVGTCKPVRGIIGGSNGWSVKDVQGNRVRGVFDTLADVRDHFDPLSDAEIERRGL